MKGTLQLSKQVSSSSLQFLTGELPIEGQLHRDVFSLLYGVWAKPDTKNYTMVKYLLSNSVGHSNGH